MNGLAPGTTYHYRAVATNSGGVTPGADMVFSTGPNVPPPTISSFVRLEDGSFRLQFYSVAGASYSVLASTNLTDWTLLGLATEPWAGEFQFTDADAGANPQRFYRLRSP